MMLFKATFSKKPDVSHDELEHLVIGYIAYLHSNGQAYGRDPYGWQGDDFIVIIHLPTAAAISPRNNAACVTDAYKKMLAGLIRKPDWQHIATDRESSFTSFMSAPFLYLSTDAFSSFARAPFLYLFTDAFSYGPPVRCGHNGGSVPTFKIPLKFAQRDELTSWSREYSDYDRIWIGSRTLETAAYRELTRLNSELTKEGRELCAQIEAVTHKPTYYYMMRYYGRKIREAQRPCPGCGKAWRAHTQVEGQPFYEFHFKCDSCRLVSHVACD